MLVTKGRLQADEQGAGGADGATGTTTVLTDRARLLIDALRAQFSGTPINEPAAPTAPLGLK